jgi:hypothetical protein
MVHGGELMKAKVVMHLLLLGEEGVVLVKDQGSGGAFSIREGEAVEVERDRRVELGRRDGHDNFGEAPVDVGTPHHAHSVVLCAKSGAASCTETFHQSLCR